MCSPNGFPKREKKAKQVGSKWLAFTTTTIYLSSLPGGLSKVYSRRRSQLWRQSFKVAGSFEDAAVGPLLVLLLAVRQRKTVKHHDVSDTCFAPSAAEKRGIRAIDSRDRR